MNFFEHQQTAKKRTRWLVLMFALAVSVIILLVDLVLLMVFGGFAQNTADGSSLAASTGGLVAGAVGTALLVLLASLFRFITLSAGGGKVARDLGGTLVDADTRDFKRRQLRNVVEEMSIAAGIPVPDIYVLEKEQGVNAFAAGATTSDAAVAVTRGLLDSMSRDELQGVIAHEFSHILNGDMRLNLRLMGLLFGILVIAIIGRKILHGASRARSGKGGAGTAIIGLAVMLIGYSGLFFGRWIKAAVSRQREFLADASAVQFTRNPDSIGGALKKIAVHGGGTWLAEDTEEVSHMLFGEGAATYLFATHPPVIERIRRIQPGFREVELDAVRRRLERRLAAESAESRPSAARAAAATGSLIDLVGSPDLHGLLNAALLVAAIPAELMDAAHSVEWAPALLFYSRLADKPEIRTRQLVSIARVLGHETDSQGSRLSARQPGVSPAQRLPLFELAFPAIKRRPLDELRQLHATIGQLVIADSSIDTFEYLLGRLIQQHLEEADNPAGVRLSGSRALDSAGHETRLVLAVLAGHGHRDPAAAAQGFARGLGTMGLPPASYAPVDDWSTALDDALPRLNLLKPGDKQRLVDGLLACVMHDENVATAELELLRVLCGVVHVPLPLFDAGQHWH